MPTISSLLRSAESRARRLRELEDSMIAYDYQLSSKSYEDLQSYTGYLTDRANKTSDPSQRLSYQKAIDSARSGYISNEIQRQSINVIEGRGTNTDKYNRMLDLYYMAADNGQYDLATSLHLQLDNLSVTIQNEREAAARARASSGKANTEYIDSYKEASKTYQDTIDELIDVFSTSKKGDFQPFIDEYASQLKLPAGTDLFGVISHLASSASAILQEGFENAPNTKTRIQLENAYNTLTKSGIVSLPTAGKEKIQMTYKELASAVGLAQFGQYPLTSALTTRFNPETGQLETVNTFMKQSQTGFTYGRGADGKPVLIPTYGAVEDDFSKAAVNDLINKMGGGSLPDTYEKLLELAGFDVKKDAGGLFITPTANSGLNRGFAPGTPVQAFVGPNGKLQFVGTDGLLYNFNFDAKSGSFLGVQESKPDALIGLGDVTARPYLSTLDPNQFPANAIALVGPEAIGRVGQNATNLIQRAAVTRRVLAAQEQQRAASALALQPAIDTRSLLNAPAGATLSLAKAPPLPKLTLAKPKPLPKLTLAPPSPRPSLQLGSGPSLQGGAVRLQ